MNINLKITGAILIGIFFSLYGFFEAQKLILREKELYKLLEGIRIFKINLLYENRELDVLLNSAFKNIYFLFFGNNKVYIKQSHFNKDDIVFITDFFNKVGLCSRNEEIKKCEMFESEILRRQKMAKLKAEKSARVFITAGICLGLAAAVIII